MLIGMELAGNTPSGAEVVLLRTNADVALWLLRQDAVDGRVEDVKIDSLAKRMGVSRATAYRALDKLDTSGVIRWNTASRKRTGSIVITQDAA